MHLAKHHYAIELAKCGNLVYFLNPPSNDRPKGEVEIKKSEAHDSLFLINHSFYFSYKIKFKWIKLFHFLMRFHISKIIKAIGKEIDFVWSFDIGNYYPFKYFPSNALKIFHPIDEPLNKAGIDSANGCDMIFSVTNEILNKYHHLNVPKHFIHHGLAEVFINSEDFEDVKDNTIRVGLSGNLLRKDIDTLCLLKIVKENPSIIFEFWGSYKEKDSNIGGESSPAVKNFVETLSHFKNVILHGAVDPSILSLEFRRMDAFLICYDVLKDQSKGTNYHKVMEYLSTGKVVISNNITTYLEIPNLIEMNSSRRNNDELPELFKHVLRELKYYNQSAFSQNRRDFAIRNSYSNKIAEIENKLKAKS